MTTQINNQASESPTQQSDAEGSAARHLAVQALVANRAEFFRLLERLEAIVGREIDVFDAEAAIDSEFAGRKQMTRGDVDRLLTMLTLG